MNIGSSMAKKPKSDDVFIYTLIDPRNGQVKYVGKTVDPKDRLRRHIAIRLDQPMTKCKQWIAQLLASGLRPLMSVIDTCKTSDWESVEKMYIKKFRDSGVDITNIADGGAMPSQTIEQRRNSAKKMNAKCKNKPKCYLRLLLAELGRHAIRFKNLNNMESYEKMRNAQEIVRNSCGKARERLIELAKEKFEINNGKSNQTIAIA